MRGALLCLVGPLLGCSTVAAPGEPLVPGRSPVSTITAKGCGDLLARLGRKPPGVRFTGCKPFPDIQAAPVRATYEVAGKDAAAVESYLIRATGLNPLKRSCCQWDSSPAGFTDQQGGQFFVTMVSEETLVRRREEWSRIAKFQVTVEMLTEEI